MSAAQSPEWDADLMAIADAVGVTPNTQHPELTCGHLPHPMHRREFADVELAAMVGNWAQEVALDEPVPFELTDAALGYCGHCGGTGLVEHPSALTGLLHVINCPVCGGEDR